MTRAQPGKSDEEQHQVDHEISSEADVHRYARATCLTDRQVGTVGVETEWFVVDTTDPASPVPPRRTLAALTDTTPVDTDPQIALALPGGTRVTFEPGGQLELSAPPLRLPQALARTATDIAMVRTALTDDGLALIGMGTDPLRPSRQQFTTSRYTAMRRYLRSGSWPAGAHMMCSTASIQINLDAGTPGQWARRFQLAHAVGPVLLAMFAASPALAGSVTGWRSTRQALWAGIDPTRTRPVATPDGDPLTAWAQYLLAARVMLVRCPDAKLRAAEGGSTFAEWIAGRGPVDRPPTISDLCYHATTVFPPVRPRGWLELRYLDALPSGNWPVAVALTTALLDDPRAADTAADACEPVTGRWAAAALLGLGDRALLRAARECAAAARDALTRMAVGPALLAHVDAYLEGYVERGRCPADDLIDRVADGGPEGLLRAEIESVGAGVAGCLCAAADRPTGPLSAVTP